MEEMGSVGVCINEDWTSLSKMFFGDDETDFSLQFLESFGAPSNSCRTDETNTNGIVNIANFDEIDNPNFYLSQESYTSHSIDACFPTPSNENQDFIDSNHQSMMNIDIVDLMSFCVTGDEINVLPQGFPNDNAMQDVLRLNEEIRHDVLVNAASNTHVDLKRKSEVPEQLKSPIKRSSEFVERPRKKSRVTRDTPKSKWHAQTKKTQKPIANVNNTEEQSYITCLDGQCSSSFSSEVDSNVSQDLNNVEATALDSNGKSRAVRGAATDPQSLYARKRRERINERLKILQTLVPNGTKVDISTMLEEAVHYVKFLQLQIKLLSSDDMLMYAPIAYNGMDMDLYQKISTAF